LYKLLISLGSSSPYSKDHEQDEYEKSEVKISKIWPEDIQTYWFFSTHVYETNLRFHSFENLQKREIAGL